MIVKRVANFNTRTKVASIRALVDYIREPHNKNPDEKVLYANGRGFICDTHAGQREEMVALAFEAVRSQYPVNHYILSWREGEHPTPEQVEEAVTIFLAELGLDGHQVIYGLHGDTDNIHLHIAVNRVHPETSKVVKVNRGFDLEAALRAVAKIEHAQGWQREKNSLYEVLDDGEVARTRTTEKRQWVSRRGRDMENRTGEKSAQRIAIEDGAAIIERAQTWEQLHRELAAVGMRYEKTGSGAVVFVGDVAVKASSVSRNASLSKLQKRLGAYQPAQPGQQVAPRAPEPIMRMPGWPQYIAARKSHYADKDREKRELDKRIEAECRELAERQRQRRREILAGDWRGRGDLLNALRSVLAAEQAAERAALMEAHRLMREQWRRRFRPFPDFETWLRLSRRPDLAERWRHRLDNPSRIEGEWSEPPTPRDIRAFQAEIAGEHVYYTWREGQYAGGVAFTDRGKTIDIHTWRNPDSLLAALQLAAQKWGSFIVTGSDEYKEACVRLAAEHGFRIDNPELQDAIHAERERLRQERAAEVAGQWQSADDDASHLSRYMRYRAQRQPDPEPEPEPVRRRSPGMGL